MTIYTIDKDIITKTIEVTEKFSLKDKQNNLSLLKFERDRLNDRISELETELSTITTELKLDVEK